MDFLVINIGNTFSEIAINLEGKLELLKRVATVDFEVATLPNLPIAVATVVPQAKEVLKNHSNEVFYVDSLNTCDIINYELMNNHLTIGMDRIANVVNLVRLNEVPGLVVDCGTAITFEGLDAEKHFKGGAIIPGRLLQRKSLFMGTKQLPEIDLQDTLRRELGLDTATSIQFGIDNCLVGGVAKMIDLIKQQRQFDCKVFATGGDRKIFMDNIPDLIDGGDLFTLEGIKFAYEMVKKVI